MDKSNKNLKENFQNEKKGFLQLIMPTITHKSTPLEVDVPNAIDGRIQYFRSDKNYTRRMNSYEESQREKTKFKISKLKYKIGKDCYIEKCKDDRPILEQAFENLYRFCLGSVGGVIGSSVVYPIDFVKTRMQNVRIGPTGEAMYSSYFDCFRKTIQREGFFGIYKGLVPQLLGVAPEKALKLTVHGFVYDRVYLAKIFDNNLYCHLLGGMSAGLAQVLVTNPLEIVKVRLQIAGESGIKLRAAEVVKQLGLRGLYKGGFPCILRDIHFSGLYFPLYSYLKSKLANADGYNPPWTLLCAGTMAGVPAAGYVTPFDVIKTRIQVIPKPGDTVYHGILDCVRKIMAEEGMRTFWTGTLARIMRTAPQFGITLAMFEIMQRLFFIDFHNKVDKK